MSPFTLAQNSLHGSFGMSGDISAVPPKAATIGPAEVIGSKNRIDTHALTVHGTQTSWQRLMTRLCLHGPVTPKQEKLPEPRKNRVKRRAGPRKPRPSGPKGGTPPSGRGSVPKVPLVKV